MHTLVVGFSLSKTQTGRRDHCRLVQNTKYRDCRKSNEWVGDPGTDSSKRGSGPMNQMGELPPVPYILIMSLGERTHAQDREKILQAISIHWCSGRREEHWFEALSLGLVTQSWQDYGAKEAAAKRGIVREWGPFNRGSLVTRYWSKTKESQGSGNQCPQCSGPWDLAMPTGKTAIGQLWPALEITTPLCKDCE